jgi:hypothetical protein
MVRNITRYSPDTCGCVVEYYVDTDFPDQEPKFLLMNNVCDKHMPLATTTHRENHAELSKLPLDLIEEAKTVNLNQVHGALAKATRASHKRDLMQCRTQVMQHNDRITEEWNELIQPPHAFDQHIYDQVMKENRAKNAESKVSSGLSSA